MKRQEIIDAISGSLPDYYANSIGSDTVLGSAELEKHPLVDHMRDIIALSQREWDEVPCDPEGATAEQDALMDAVIERTATAIADIITR